MINKELCEIAILERSISNINQLVLMLVLQKERIKEKPSPSSTFIMAFFWDFQFFIIILSRIKKFFKLATNVQNNLLKKMLSKDLDDFNNKTKWLDKLRNVAEHYDEYAVGKGHNKEYGVERGQLDVSNFDGENFIWLNETINLDEAIKSSYDLLGSLRKALKQTKFN